jgi:uncharacterized protein (TIGR00269 family)
MNCTFCGNEAVYVRPYDKTALCKPHFNEQVKKRVQKALTRYKMLKRSDRIAIGVSGGKDSIALLHILNKIEKDFPESELVAITIDEGIENYREEGLFFAKKHVKELELEHHIYSFKNDFGYDLDEILKILGERGKEREFGACSYCGILRRKILNKAAKDIGADVLVTAHNLEDEVETILLNIVRGDIQRLARLDPHPRKIHESLVPRVKPFRTTPQAEIVLYCVLNDLEYQEIPCPHAVEAYRGDVRDFVFKTQEKQPMLAYNVLRGQDKLLEIMKTTQPKGTLKSCESCGEATAGKICKACWLKNQIDQK